MSRTKLLISVLFLGIAGCSGVGSRRPDSTATKPAASADVPYKKLDVKYDKPIVGAEVRVSGSELPAGKTAELRWGTVTGGWVIEDYYHFRGKKYSETVSSLGTFPIDAKGQLDTSFKIPEDYGGVHEVTAIVDGKPLAQGGVEVRQTFEMRPSSGPVGTPIELKVTGLGWRTMESTWVVNWDNIEVGFVSAAGTRGSAVARFRAAGPAGNHVVKMLTGWQGQGYLNYEQSPVAHLPRPQFTFRITAGRYAGSTAYAEPYQRQSIPKNEVRIPNAKVALSPVQGPIGMQAKLSGEGFAKGEKLKLVWETAAGSRVSGNGFETKQTPFGEITVGDDGRFAAPVTIPDDLGGRHSLMLMRGGEMIALTYFVIETSIAGITPASGPAGTPVSIHLKGVGWTEYDNIYVATYDNAYMGYACGFNSQGDVVINFTAAGSPGMHVIDLYPGIYQGPPTEPQLLYRLPQLTYADDHPGNKIPALRFMFEITR